MKSHRGRWGGSPTNYPQKANWPPKEGGNLRGPQLRAPLNSQRQPGTPGRTHGGTWGGGRGGCGTEDGRFGYDGRISARTVLFGRFSGEIQSSLFWLEAVSEPTGDGGRAALIMSERRRQSSASEKSYERNLAIHWRASPTYHPSGSLVLQAEAKAKTLQLLSQATFAIEKKRPLAFSPSHHGCFPAATIQSHQL